MPRNTVALGVRGPTLAEGGGAINPLMPIQALEGISRIQNMQNQNRLFQAEMAGRQRFGEILSQNPDEQAAFTEAMHDPVAAPYAMTQIQGYRASLLAQRQINESIGKDVHTGLEAIMKAAPQAAFDPQGYQNTLNAYYLAIPKDAREAARVPFQYIQTSMFGGLDGMTPQQQNAEISKRAMGLGIGSGALTPDSVRNIMGLPAPGVDTLTGPGGESIPVVRQVPLAGPGAGQVGFSRIPMPGEGPIPGPTAPQADTTTTTPNALGGTTTASPGTLVAPPGQVQPPGSAQPSSATAGTGGSTGTDGTIHGPTITQQKTAEKEAENVQDIQKEVDASVTAIPIIANRLNALQDTVRSFPAGGWASSRANLASWIQGAGHSMGVRPEIVDQWANSIIGSPDDRLGGLAAQQAFHALVGQYAIEQLKEVAKGTGRVMQMEVTNAMNSISENLDPRAIEYLLNTQARPALQLGADRVNKWLPFKRDAEAGKVTGTATDAQGKAMTYTYRPADFFNWYGTQSTGDLPTTFGKVGGGIPIGPRDPAEAIGGALGPKVYFNPEGKGSLQRNPYSPTPRSATPSTGGTTTGPDTDIR